MKNCLVVLGMHRSGTSAFTGILDRLGVDLGGKLLETQSDNARGFFENKFVVQINDALLAALQTSWDDVLPLPLDWQRYFDDSRTGDDILNFLRDELPAQQLSALKDPRLCRLLPYWLPLFARADVQPRFALVVRNPADIARSLAERNDFSEEKSIVLWLQHTFEAELHTRHLPRGFVDYNTLLEHPQASVAALFEAAGLDAPPDNGAVDDFVDPSLRHHAADPDTVRERGFTLAADLYDCLRAIAARGAPTEEELATIDALRDSFDRQQQLFYNRDITRLREQVRPLTGSDAYAQALEAVREDFEADQLHREFRYISNTAHLNKEVASLLAQREELNRERDALRNDRDTLAQEREGLRGARDSLIEERDGLREARDAVAADRDEVRADRDAVAADREAIRADRDAIRADRDAVLARCQTLDANIAALDAQLRAALQERDALALEQTRFWGSKVGKAYDAYLRAAARVGRGDPIISRPSTSAEAAPVEPVDTAAAPAKTPPPPAADDPTLPAPIEEHAEQASPPVEESRVDTTTTPAPAAPSATPDTSPDAPPEATWEPIDFATSDSPQVSIIIPVFNNWSFTYACLRSVAEHTTAPFELIVVDNHSTDATPELLRAMGGITVITNDTNEVFVNACNQAAAQARGQYILLLNNDTEVSPGWLEALLEPMEDERTGIVGGKLVYPDGRLQEAGGIIWRDGTGCNYGHGDDPDLPQYNYRKAVDYCSGACLLVRRSLWETLGGFDTRYAPAYYEDTDLCFAARDLHYKVIYQPRARIVHFGGASAGKETTSGYKRFQDINQHKFVEKWATVLEREHVLSDQGTYGARTRQGQQQMLVIDHYVPTFDRDSGSQRMISMLQILLDMDYRVSFWPHDLSYDDKYSRALQDMGVEVFYGDIGFEDYMIAHGEAQDVVLMSRPATARHYLETVRKYTRARTIFDTVDLHFVREQRRLELEVQQWKNLEFYLAQNTDHTFVVSPVEKELLANESFADKVAVVSNIHSLEPCEKGFEERAGLLFIGGFAHPPNEEGVLWFIDYVLPQIRNKLPDIPLTIIGSNPTDAVLAKASDTITITGFVEDVSDYFNNARVFVSPLLHGAGVKGKIGQSFSYGLPVVTTSIGAEGMSLVDGHNALIADTETAFADQIVELYTERTLWQTLSVNGRKVITEQFSPATIRSALETVLGQPAGGEPAVHKRSVLLHCHLFKNAGTTLDWSLARQFGDAFVDHREDDKMREGARFLGPYLAEHSSVRALSSHHIQFPLPEPEAYELLLAVLLRHPVDRAHSVYAFERRQEAFTPGAVKAKELDFADYIRWRLEDDVAPTVRNFQCSHLTSSGKTPIDRPRYEAALATLIDAPLVGTVERYDESMVLFEARLADTFAQIDLAYVRQNSTGERTGTLAERIARVEEALGSALYDAFLTANSWDIKLHEDANAILTERLGGLSHLDRRLEHFAARCQLLAEQ
jgi:GT2 family glycosyltransferase/glycosyltransferase involved in cell wall biosynthesis